MLKFRDWRIRVLFTVALLTILGVAVWYFTIDLKAKRQFQMAQQAIELGDFEEAGVHLEIYLSLRPSDAAIHILAAQTARRCRGFAEADRHLRLAEKSGAKGSALDLERILCGIQKGDLALAKHWATFSAVNSTNPMTRPLLEALIEGSLATSRKQLASWSIDQWLKDSSATLDQARGLVWRGMLEDSVSNWKAAHADYARAAEMAPDYLPVRLAFARAQLRADPHLATSELEWLRRHAPKNPKVLFLTAQWHRLLGRSQDAAELLDQLLAADPNRLALLIERGRVGIDLQQLPDAERRLSRALELAPDLRETNAAMGDCLRLMGRLDEAKIYQDKVQKQLEDMRNMSKADSAPPIK